MSWYSNIDLGAAVDSASSAASSGNWLSQGWQTASKYATSAFDWMGDNPEAANLLGGIAGGIGQAYMGSKQLEAQKQEARQNRAFEREMYDKRKRDRQVAPGEVNDYGSHRETMTKGLISNGMIAGGE